MPLIGEKIASGVFWTVGMRFSIRLLGVVSIVILARILVPGDFGIVAKAAMISSFLELITTFGLEAALIKNQSATAAHYNTVWTLHAIRGAAIGVALAVVAHPASVFFHEPALNRILYCYALLSVIRGAVNVGTVDFRKNLDFDKDFRFNLIRKLAGFFATIIVAYIWRSYWAFVVGVLAASVTAFTTSFVMSTYRPRFSLAEWRSLFNFSKWVFVFGVVSSMSKKLDTFILSRLSTTEGLGQYTVANDISGTASTEIAMPVARATMPGLAKLNDDPGQFRKIYTTSVLVLLFVAVPAGVGVSALAEDITSVVLGNKWSAAAPLIQILAFFGIVRAVFAVSTSAYMSSGRVDILAKLSIVDLTLRIVFLAAGYYLSGILGLAWGVLASAALQMLITVAAQHNIGLLKAPVLVTQLWRVIAAAAIMFASIRLTLPVFDVYAALAPISTLLVEVAFGAAIYASVLAVLWFVSGNRQGPEMIVVIFLKERLPNLGKGKTR
jgi:lipopolysaccharide exporter